MMDSDLKLMKKDQYLYDGGFNTKIIFNMISKSSKIYIAGHTGPYIWLLNTKKICRKMVTVIFL